LSASSADNNKEVDLAEEGEASKEAVEEAEGVEEEAEEEVFS
jgi:hypothetical protein